MRRYYYDLHLHSCLSPCGDDDNTPNNIAGMASLCGLDIIALTDHNSCKNCPAFFEAVKKYGIIPIAGMELTTAEDIHIVCLFEHLNDAMEFDKFVEDNKIKVKNKTHIFGNQIVMDGEDNHLFTVDDLLINATNISIVNVSNIVKKFNGVCYPAHIDRDANGIIAILGTLPSDLDFNFYELHDINNIVDYSLKYKIKHNQFIISSDAHYLTDMRDKESSFVLEEGDEDNVRSQLFKILRS